MTTTRRTRTARRLTALLALTLFLAGCAASQPPPPPSVPPQPSAPEIRVGITLDSPPFVMQEGQQVSAVGIEIDFAKRLSFDLKRPLRVIALTWNELIPALLNGQIDIIMSGMTITRLRSMRVAFSDPYMDSGLSVLIRNNLGDGFKTPEQALSGTLRIGVTRGTTADSYVTQNYRGGQVFPYLSNSDGIADLVQSRIDAFVTDAPIVAWFASAHDGTLRPLIRPLLTQEQLGWGFRPGDENLRAAANASLANWKAEGFIDRTITRWIPLYKAR
ncbi:MAG: transporter substrate-binding domain-containing protein [Steroidobacteraceae bacterium]